MEQNNPQNIIRLRILVGYLGEKSQRNWWPSEFFSATAPAFLNPIFGKTTRMAQYQGVKEAARRVHDEHIGIGRVFHLFRLPETMERSAFEHLWTQDADAAIQRDTYSESGAMAALRSLFDACSAIQPGPVQIGPLAAIGSDHWLSAVAGCYHTAFATRVLVYPYFVDQG